MKNFIYIFLAVAFICFIDASAFAQTQDRRMIFDRYDCGETAADEDEPCLVELIDVQIAGQTITSGKPFVADENWLKNLKVKIKNVSGKPFVFVGVSFGLMEGLYEELAPGASWGWGFGLSRGKISNPDDEKKKISKEIVLKPDEEMELNYSDLADFYKKSRLMQVVGKMSQIVLRTATVEFEDGRQENGFLLNREKAVDN